MLSSRRALRIQLAPRAARKDTTQWQTTTSSALPTSEFPVYDAQAIELKWQKAWEEQDLFHTDEDPAKPKKYVLEMFPYPSGDLHMGHARNYTIGDAMARQARMRGFDVLHPMGFDAFGLPAENAAIKHNTQAAKWTYANMDNALATMRRMGFSYDYDRLVRTCDPEYYRWGQWMFEKMWERGLAYRKKNPVNWCPKCNTVLANEQVTDGKCWRCGSVPEKRDLEQWYLKITDYAQELLDDLDKLDGWPERVRQMQANWIGRSEGAEVDFTHVRRGRPAHRGRRGQDHRVHHARGHAVRLFVLPARPRVRGADGPGGGHPLRGRRAQGRRGRREDHGRRARPGRAREAWRLSPGATS